MLKNKLIGIITAGVIAASLAACGDANVQTGGSGTVNEDAPVRTVDAGDRKQTGDKISFVTADMNGETVSSEELFGKNKLTMVNLWMSWCGPCVREMPELEKLNNEYKDKGVEVVGILLDGNTKNGLEDGLDVIDAAGVNYSILLPYGGIDDQLPSQAYPTTYFIESSGNVVGAPVIGAYVNEYKRRIEEYLSKEN